MKNYSYTSSGSVLLTIIIIITLVSFLCLNVWHTTTSFFDISIKKQHYEQHIHALQGFTNWAIDICKNNFDELDNFLVTHKEGAIFQGLTMNVHNKPYKADIIITSKKQNTFLITAQLCNQDKVINCLRCYVTRTYDKTKKVYQVSEWSIHGA